MTPDAWKALTSIARALPPGSAVSVPRDWLVASEQPTELEGGGGGDLDLPWATESHSNGIVGLRRVAEIAGSEVLLHESNERWPRSARVRNLYVIAKKRIPEVKIGIADDSGERIRALRYAGGENLVLVAAFRSTEQMEKAVHHQLREYRAIGEWFSATPDMLVRLCKLFEDRIQMPTPPTAEYKGYWELFLKEDKSDVAA